MKTEDTEALGRQRAKPSKIRTLEVDYFMFILSDIPICIKIGSKYCVHKFGNRQTDGQTDGQVVNITPRSTV